MKRIIILSLCLSFVASIAVAVPFGMPPKETPVVTKSAPEGSGTIMTWQEQGVADANSTNLVEQSLAKPEIRRMMGEIKVDILNKRSDNLLTVDITYLALKNGCLFYTPDHKSSTLAVLTPVGPDDKPALDHFYNAMGYFIKNGTLDYSTEKIGKLTFNKATARNTPNTYYWGLLGNGKIFIFGNSVKCIVTLLNSARTPEPEWVKEAKKDFDIKQMSSLMIQYSNVLDEYEEHYRTSSDLTFYKKYIQRRACGLQYIDKTITASGLDDVGAVQRMAFHMKDGWKKTMLGVFTDKSLSDSDLSVIPGNASYAYAGKMELNKFFKALNECEGLPDYMKPQIAMLNAIAAPYVNLFGDSQAYFSVKEDGASHFAFVWSLKNPALMKIQLKQLMEKLKSGIKNTQIEIEEFSLQNLNRNVLPTQLANDDDEEDDEDDDKPRIPFLSYFIDPDTLFDKLPESIEKIKIDSYEFWLLKKNEDASNDLVVGVVNRNLVVTTKAYAEKYVKYDGTNNLSSNQAVKKMMAKSPSSLFYVDHEAIPEFINACVIWTPLNRSPGLFDNPQYKSFLKIVTDADLPIVLGVHTKDNVIRVDVNYGMPIPDLGSIRYILSNGF